MACIGVLYELMLRFMFTPQTTAILSAAMGGFGVFSAIDTFDSPVVAARAIILLVGALALSSFGQRQ